MKKNFWIFLCLLVSSCDTFHEFSQTVDNTTSDTITLFFSGDEFIPYPDSILLLPNSTQVIYEYSSIGGEPNGFGCQIINTEVEAIVSGGKRLIKDLLDENNWTQNLSGKKSITEECFFEIQETDLQ